MADQTSNKRVTAIVPAFNEERDIAGVLREISSYPGFSEIIVVDDGSSDATAQVTSAFPVQLVRHSKNKGKGAAMQSGVNATNAEIIFFCDADMHGLSHTLLDEILAPVLSGETDMVIAMRNWRMYYAGFILSIIPILGGQRALTRTLWDRVPEKYREGFMVETALNFYARYWGRGYHYMVVHGLKQSIKEKKYGFWKGLMARLHMSSEVFLAQVSLQLKEAPASLTTGRIAFTNTALASSGIMIGVVAVAASYFGPIAFIRDLFTRELLEDPNAPIINLLLYIATNVGTNLIAFIGVSIIALNILVVFLNLKKLRYLAYRPSATQRIK